MRVHTPHIPLPLQFPPHSLPSQPSSELSVWGSHRDSYLCRKLSVVSSDFGSHDGGVGETTRHIHFPSTFINNRAVPISIHSGSDHSDTADSGRTALTYFTRALAALEIRDGLYIYWRRCSDRIVFRVWSFHRTHRPRNLLPEPKGALTPSINVMVTRGGTYNLQTKNADLEIEIAPIPQTAGIPSR